MQIHVKDNVEELGRLAAVEAAGILNRSIGEHGGARLILSTGASQFAFLDALGRQSIDWGKVEMFHLDEYVGLPDTHPASFRKYLRERFLSYANVKKAHWVDGDGDPAGAIFELTREINRSPVDLALIGIGENVHIAFNDPPADFESTEAYKVVDLDDDCKRQQVREGWFESLETVPVRAITMTVRKILDSRTIISFVPHAVKAGAVKRALEPGVTPDVPASILKTHADWRLYLDAASAAQTDLKTV